MAALESGAAEACDWLLKKFGESYADGLWIPLSSNGSLPANASPEDRAAAEKLAQASGLAMTIAQNVATDAGVPGDCIGLEMRPVGSTPDVNGDIILHANKSTVITATNQPWLDAAVERFIASFRERNKKREAPFSLATSFQSAR